MLLAQEEEEKIVGGGTSTTDKLLLILANNTSYSSTKHNVITHLDDVFSNAVLNFNQSTFLEHYQSEMSEGADERTFLQDMYYFYMPFCVFVGLTGNTMVWILIRSNRMLSKLPTNIYLLCLAAVSSFFLFSLLVFWIEEVANIYFYDIFEDSILRNSNYSCIFNTFLAHVCDFSSVWLIVLVGFERLILLYMKTKMLTVDRACVQVVCLLMVAMCFNSWILIVAEVDIYGQCDIKEEYVGLYELMTYLETFFCMALPSIIIIFSNVLVVLKLNQHMRRNPGLPAVSFNNADVVVTTQTTAPVCHSLKSTYIRVSKNSADEEGDDQVMTVNMMMIKKKGIRYTDIQLTRSLLIVTSAFILLNLPNYVYRISNVLLGVSDQTPFMQKISLLAHVFLYTHHAFLFYLYIFYSPQMKRRLKPTAMKLLECYCFKPPSEYIDHT